MKSEQIIMVVKREALFCNDYFEGFMPQEEIDYESRILSNFEHMKRGPAEEDAGYKQPIGYCMIVNLKLKQVFAYQRSSNDAKYAEKRLQGKWSWGVGGHIEKFDAESKNPIHLSVLRELGEEVEAAEMTAPKVLGYINYDTDDIGKVHFGILYIVETGSEYIMPKDPEIDNGRLRAIKELEHICQSPEYRVEEWSRISLSALNRYFNQ